MSWQLFFKDDWLESKDFLFQFLVNCFSVPFEYYHFSAYLEHHHLFSLNTLRAPILPFKSLLVLFPTLLSYYSIYLAHLFSLLCIFIELINYFLLASSEANNELPMCLQKEQGTLICSIPKAYYSSKHRHVLKKQTHKTIQTWSQGRQSIMQRLPAWENSTWQYL